MTEEGTRYWDLAHAEDVAPSVADVTFRGVLAENRHVCSTQSVWSRQDKCLHLQARDQATLIAQVVENSTSLSLGSLAFARLPAKYLIQLMCAFDCGIAMWNLENRKYSEWTQTWELSVHERYEQLCSELPPLNHGKLFLASRYARFNNLERQPAELSKLRMRFAYWACACGPVSCRTWMLADKWVT